MPSPTRRLQPHIAVASGSDTAVLADGGRDFDFVIVGGGILGTAVSTLASVAGYRVLTLRLHDNGRPRADTLRNQGWLQSGLLYRRSLFNSEDDYRNLGRTTLAFGRQMLAECQLRPSPERGIARLRTRDAYRNLRDKARLLQLVATDQDETEDFRRLEIAEAKRRLGDFFEPDSIYHIIPDAPFDEAAVLRYLRTTATAAGARFIDLPSPVEVELVGPLARIRCPHLTINAPVVLVAAGAGVLPIMAQVRHAPMPTLRRTPLLVLPGTCGMSVPLFVDIDRGFSAVRHLGDPVPAGALVIGTRVHENSVSFTPPDLRKIPKENIAEFLAFLPAHISARIATGRFTAGYELIPNPPKAYVEPWIVERGPLLFASPGRATIGLAAATQTLAALLAKRKSLDCVIQATISEGCSSWDCDIAMHFTDHYSFCDAEK